jgi:tRNA(Ile)-lysidine synthase
MALLHLLAEGGWKNLVVCHLDHGLRGAASRADSTLVRKTARRLGLPFETARADTAAFAAQHGLSLELAAREMRHAFFEICARKHRCRRLFLAHHAGDQIETILFNFLRGTGAAGLSGMKRHSSLGKIAVFRPLLATTPEDIAQFIRSRKIPFREDASNTSPAHTRNRIRHSLIPAIEKTVGPQFRGALLRAATLLESENALLESLTPEPADDLSCAALRALPLALQRRLVLRWLKHHNVAEPGFTEVQRVLSLLDPAGGPAKINLPAGRHARRSRGRIFLA